MEHELLTKHQSGNRKWHSTKTLNVVVTDAQLEAIDKKQLSIIIFLHISKAFDSDQQDILLNKIMDLRVTTEVLNWFKSYLFNRSQYARIGAATSTCAALEHGIPQGSVLSPFLFNIYTDSLPSGSKSCNLFVDDSKTFLTFPVSSLTYSLEAIEKGFQRIFQWCCNHSLLINPENQNADSWITTNDAADSDSAEHKLHKQKSYTDNGSERSWCVSRFFFILQ